MPRQLPDQATGSNSHLYNDDGPRPETVVKMDWHPHIDPLKPDELMPRTVQQTVLPTAVNVRAIGNLYSSNPSGIVLGTANFVTTTVTNSTSSTITQILTDKQNRIMIAIPDISVFIGTQSQISNSTQWPTPAVGGGNFPVYINRADWGLSDNKDVVARVTCRNNTGSDQTITVAFRWRVLTLPSTTAPTSPVATGSAS